MARKSDPVPRRLAIPSMLVFHLFLVRRRREFFGVYIFGSGFGLSQIIYMLVVW